MAVNILLTIAIVTSVIPVCLSQSPFRLNSTCPQRSDCTVDGNTQHPHCSDCTQFIVCLKGNYAIVNCPATSQNDAYYDIKTGRCTSRDDAVCGTQTGQSVVTDEEDNGAKKGFITLPDGSRYQFSYFSPVQASQLADTPSKDTENTNHVSDPTGDSYNTASNPNQNYPIPNERQTNSYDDYQSDPVHDQHQYDPVHDQHQTNAYDDHQSDPVPDQYQSDPVHDQHQTNAYDDHQSDPVPDQYQSDPVHDQHQTNAYDDHQSDPVQDQYQSDPIHDQHQTNAYDDHQSDPVHDQHQTNAYDDHQSDPVYDQHQTNAYNDLQNDPVHDQHQTNAYDEHQSDPVQDQYQSDPVQDQHVNYPQTGHGSDPSQNSHTMDPIQSGKIPTTMLSSRIHDYFGNLQKMKLSFGDFGNSKPIAFNNFLQPNGQYFGGNPSQYSSQDNSFVYGQDPLAGVNGEDPGSITVPIHDVSHKDLSIMHYKLNNQIASLGHPFEKDFYKTDPYQYGSVPQQNSPHLKTPSTNIYNPFHMQMDPYGMTDMSPRADVVPEAQHHDPLHSQHQGYPTNSQQQGYPSNSQQQGYPTNSQQQEYPTNSQQQGYPTNSQQQEYPTNSQQQGYPTNSQQEEYPTNSQQQGYPTNNQEYPTNSQQQGYPTNSQQQGYPGNRDQQGYPTNIQQQNPLPSQQQGYPVNSQQQGYASNREEQDSLPRQQQGYPTKSQENSKQSYDPQEADPVQTEDTPYQTEAKPGQESSLRTSLELSQPSPSSPPSPPSPSSPPSPPLPSLPPSPPSPSSQPPPPSPPSRPRCTVDCRFNGQRLNGLFQHCDTCSMYVDCRDGNANLVSCPVFQDWDDSRKQCVSFSSTCHLYGGFPEASTDTGFSDSFQ